MTRYLAEKIPIEYHNPERNVWLVPCWAEDLNAEVIEVSDDWDYPLPDDLSDPLPDAIEQDEDDIF